MTRLLAVLLAVFFLGLAALLASVTFFVRDPMPVLTTRAPVVFTQGEPGADGPRTTVAVDPTYRFEVTGQNPGDTPPRVSMRRAEGDQSAVEVEVTAAGEGLFQAHGQFTAPGRWTLQLEDATGTQDFTFILQE
ncbi:MAG: hypothetical protein ACXIUV_03120 [Alkalilacustris sp.]